MSNLFKYTKRVLTSVLAAALVVTAIPSTAFGAEIVDEDIEVVTLQEDAQEAEVTEAGAVEEDAFTADGASGEEVIEEEEQEPDTYTSDTTITVTKYPVAATALAGIFTVNGSTATLIGQSSSTDGTISYDSDDNQEVYIAPAVGYELEDAPFTLTAGWKKLASDTATSYADYTAAKTAGMVSEIVPVDISGTNIPADYDGSKAVKITFLAGSAFANACADSKMQTAATAYATVPYATLALAATPATASTVNVYAYQPGNTTFGNGALLGEATYAVDWTGVSDAGVDVVGSSFDWTGVTAKVGILKGFDSENKPEWDGSAWTIDDTSVAHLKGNTLTDSYFLVGGKKLAINAHGVNSAYAKNLTKGYELAIVLTRDEEDLSHIHTLSADPSDYYTVTSSTLNKTDATTKVKSGKVDETDTTNVFVKFAPTSAGSGARKVKDIYYKVGDADATKMVTANEIANADITALNTAEGTGYGSSDGATATADGWRQIDPAEITADTTLYATTTEKINFNNVTLATISGNANRSTVTVALAKVAEHKNEAVATGLPVKNTTYAGLDGYCTSLTGKPFSFSIVPYTGYEITEVVAKVYGVNGTGYDTIDLTGTGVNGVYTINSVTANIDVSIKTAELGPKAATISLTADPTGATVALSATGEPISSSEAPSIKTGAEAKFEATAAPGYWIKKLEYKVGATGETKTLAPTSISSKGVFNYTLSAAEVTGQVNLTFTMGDAPKKDSVKITKLTNEKAKITIGGTELKDFSTGDYMIVPTSSALNFVVEPQNGAETDKVAYEALANIASTDSISSVPTATTKTSGTTTYTLTTEELKAADRDGTKGIALIATTKEEAAASTFKAVWNSTNDGSTLHPILSPNHVDTSKGEVLTEVNLVAGGTDSTDAITDQAATTLKNIDIIAEDNIVATFYKADGKTPVAAGSATYKLGKAATDPKAIATATTTSGTTDLESTLVAGNDTLTAEYAVTGSFPHSLKYTSTIPVTVTALNEVYDIEGFSLKSNVSDKAADFTTYTNVDKAGLSRTGKTIRAIANDIIRLNPQFTDKDDDGTDNTNDILIDSTTNSLVSGITWSAVNNKGEEYDPDNLLPAYGLFTSSNYAAANAYDVTDNTKNIMVVAGGQEAQTVDVTAKITYLDSTTDTVTGTVTIIPDTKGYFAIPTVTVGSGEPVYNGTTPTANLEVATGNGLNTATVKYDIYKAVKIDAGDVTAWNGKTAAKIAEMVELGKIKPVTTGIDFGKGLQRTSAESTDGVATASSPALTYTITAAKAGTKTFKPDFSVDGVPVTVTTTDLSVVVVNNLPSLTVTLNTDNGSAPFAKTANFDAPKLKDTAAWLAKTHGVTLGGTKKTPIAYTYKNVAEGTKVTLPTQADFDETSYDSKRVLWAWTSGGKGFAPGASVTISSTYSTFTPVWAIKYTTDGSTPGVEVAVGGGKSALAATTTLAVDATIPFFIKYQGLDYDARNKAIADGSFNGAVVYKAAKDAETTQTGMELSFTTSSAKATLVENNTAVKGVDAAGVDPVLKIEFVEFKGTTYEAKYTPLTRASTTISVQAAKTYSITAEEITVEENQVKPVAITVKDTTGGADTTISLKDSGYFDPTTPSKNLTAKVTSEAVAKVVADDSVNSGIIVTGLKAGQNTTFTLELTDKNGTVTTSQPIKVTVSGATKKIVANRASGDSAYWNDEAGMLIETETSASAKTLTFGVKDLNTQAVVNGSGWTVKDSTPDSVPAARRICTVSSGDVKFVSNTLSYKAKDDVFGQAQVDVTATVDGNTYMATFPVTSMYPITFTNDDTTNVEVYEGTTKATADIVKPVYYTGATTYTVSDSNKITAKWIGTSANPEFFGWGTSTLPYPSATVADADAYLAGESFVINEDDLAAITVYPIFAEPEISVTGLPSEIVLSDEKFADGTTAGTDALAFTTSITPASSSAEVDVDADKKNFLTLNYGDKTKKAVGTGGRTTYDGTNGLFDTSGVASGSRLFEFTVGSVGTPGKANLLVTFNGGQTKIPVYVNGEYTDTTVTPIVDRYLEKGEVLVSGVRTVNGEQHYYKDSAKVEKGAVKDESGKTILIVNGKIYKTVGAIAIDGDVYYVGTDGFVKTAGLFVGEAAGDKNKTYFANADGTLVTGELKEVGGKTYYFNGTGAREEAASTADKYALSSDGKYYVNEAGEVAIKGIFKVDGKDRLFREDGSIVKHTDADVKDGKKVVDGVTYLIADDDTAKRDDVWYAPQVTWATKFPSKWDKKDSIPVMAYTVTYTSANTGKTETTDSIIATVTSNPSPIPSDAKEVTFTATADLSAYFQDKAGTKKAENATLTKKYTFKSGGETGSGGGIEIQGLEPSYKFTGAAIKPAITVVDNDLGITLAQGTDYTVSYKDNTKLNSTATVTVTGKGNYQGKNVTGNFKIVSPTEGLSDLAGSVKNIVKISESFVYDGTEKYPSTITVNTSDGQIVYQHNSGDSYTTDSAKEVGLSFANNVNAGSATVAATGADGKAKKTTFKINKVDLSAAGSKLEITASDVEWAAKGAIPGVTVTYTPEDGAAITLIEGQDYKLAVNYADKKKNVAKGNTVKITGKGTNFTKSATSTDTFEITPYTLKDEDIFSVNIFQGQKAGSVKPVVLDGNGVAIPKAQYDFALINGELTVDSKAKLEAGVTYKAVVKAKEGGNLDGEASVEVEARPDLSKAKVTLSDSLKKSGVAYTGEAINLENYGDDSINFFENGGITVELKNSSKVMEKLVYGTDFEVAGYQNALKKGTMTVYIRGISEKCSGTKSFKVKIGAKTMQKAD